MKVCKDLSVEIPGTNVHYFNLEEFSSPSSKTALFYGYSFLEQDILSRISQEYDKKIYLNVTMPTEFCSTQNIYADDIFDEVWGICPFSVEWLNGIKNTNKYKNIFYPFNERDIPAETEKFFDVIYHGGVHGSKYVKMLENISTFNYKYLTQTHGINGLTQQMLNFSTDRNLTNEQKLQTIARTKISICFNTFEIRNQQDLINIKAKPCWHQNKAFMHIEDRMIAPQFKSRCNEAAFCKTLNLVQKDPWNLIERYYAKDEFVYFEEVEELPEIINLILSHWDDYQDVINKAFLRSLNYTTKNAFIAIRDFFR